MELPVFVENVPTYEVRNGRMHIELGGFAIVMPVAVFQAGCIKGRAAIARWQIAQMRRPKGKVVRMPRKQH